MKTLLVIATLALLACHDRCHAGADLDARVALSLATVASGKSQMKAPRCQCRPNTECECGKSCVCWAAHKTLSKRAATARAVCVEHGCECGCLDGLPCTCARSQPAQHQYQVQYQEPVLYPVLAAAPSVQAQRPVYRAPVVQPALRYRPLYRQQYQPRYQAPVRYQQAARRGGC